MKSFRWNNEKNEVLKEERNVSFEVILEIILEKKYLEIIKNESENHIGQNMYIININNYIFLVPFVETEEEIFLKIIIPSRKYTKIYLKK